MRLEALDTADDVGKAAATAIAQAAAASVSERGHFVLALSRASRAFLDALAAANIPWAATDVLQVDERVAPAGHPDRNLTAIAEVLLSGTRLAAGHLHAMPVDDGDLEGAAARYAVTLGQVAGTPPIIDLVHLGLGSNGHTASLLPGDPVLGVADRDVAVSATYQGYRRMTLTYPALDRAAAILWVVTGPGKTPMLRRLLAGDREIPAGRVRRDTALVLAQREP